MNFNNSACFGYGSNVTKPSFNDTILKYFLQKYNMSCLHLLISLALRLNSSGVRISFSPAFLIDASSPVGLLGVFCYADANWLSCGFSYPRSKFSNLSIVGFSIPNPIYHALSPLVGLGRTNFLLLSALDINVAKEP